MKTAHKHITALKEKSPIGPYSELIGRDDLELIIVEMNDALKPCDKPVAKAEAKRLAACYPTLRPTPEWLGQIEDALKGAPCDLIQMAVARLTGEATFPPNKAQTVQMGEHLTSVRRSVLNRAKAMLDEHDRRAAANVEETERHEARKAFREKLAGRTPLQMIQEEQK